MAIVGRPNVGKSTLFNRLSGAGRQAIVHDTPGVTRDRCLAQVQWLSRQVILADTGGITTLDTRKALSDPQRALAQSVEQQSLLAIESSDYVWLLTSGQDGLHPLDSAIAKLLRKHEKPFALVINKVDLPMHESSSRSEFYRLGVASMFSVSAEHKRGLEDLVEHTLKQLPDRADGPPPEPAHFTLAIVGRPNAGKSSLLNALCQKTRSVVSAVPGTTRDTVTEIFSFENKQIRLADTAGLRRKSRVAGAVEYYSQLRAIQAIEASDVCALLLDPTQDTADHERHMARLAWDSGKALMLVIAKQDVFEDEGQQEAHRQAVKSFFNFLPDVPFVSISSLESQGLKGLLKAACALAENRVRQLRTRDLTEFAQALTSDAGKFTYASQTRHVLPPSFVFFSRQPEHWRKPQKKRFLENELRKAFSGFEGIPLKILVQQK